MSYIPLISPVYVNSGEEERDYKQLYLELYYNVAKMLVKNRGNNWSPQELLAKWDSFRK